MTLQNSTACAVPAPFVASRRHGVLATSLGFLAALGLGAPAAAQCTGPDDAYEPNDTCATALAVSSPFIGRDLWVHRHDPDLFRITVPPGRELRVDATFVDDDGDVDLVLYDAAAACGDLWTNLRAARSNDNDEWLNWTNQTTAPKVVVLQVEMWRGSIPECNTYDLAIELLLPNETCHPSLRDDQLEDNDSCATAHPLPLGTTGSLWASRDDEDFYSCTVPVGGTLDVEILFTHSTTDIDLYLFDANAPCGGGYGSGELARSFSEDDDEHIVWTNPSNVPRNVVVHVDVYIWHSCNDYAMVASISGTGVGTNFCTGTPNSTGLAGRMSARGSNVVSSNAVVLEASQLPPSSVGYFLCSRQRNSTPGSGNGASGLCLTGDVGRFNAAALPTGPNGRFELPINLAAIPQSSGNVSILASESWHFQAWYRDTSGGQALSRFTDGLTISFQ